MKRWFNYLLGACLAQPLFVASVYAVEVTESTPVYVAPGIRSNKSGASGHESTSNVTSGTTVSEGATPEAKVPAAGNQTQYTGNASAAAVASNDETDDVEDFGIITDSAQPTNPLSDDRSLLVGELQTLRSVVEEQSRELAELKTRSKALYVDLDRRIQLLTEKVTELESRKNSAVVSSGSTASADSSSETTPTVASTSGKESDQVRYRKAKSILDEGGRDTKAALEFVKILKDYPDTPLKPNIYYWLAQIYKRSGEMEKAEGFYNRVLEEYPSSIKAASSLYSLASLKASTGKNAEAKGLWEKLLKQYPSSAEAVKAKTKLEGAQ